MIRFIVLAIVPVMLSSLRLGDRNSDNYDDEDMSYEGSADTYGDFALAPLFDTFKVRYILAKLDHPRLGKSFFKISYSSYNEAQMIEFKGRTYDCQPQIPTCQNQKFWRMLHKRTKILWPQAVARRGYWVNLKIWTEGSLQRTRALYNFDTDEYLIRYNGNIHSFIGSDVLRFQTVIPSWTNTHGCTRDFTLRRNLCILH